MNLILSKREAHLMSPFYMILKVDIKKIDASYYSIDSVK